MMHFDSNSILFKKASQILAQTPQSLFKRASTLDSYGVTTRKATGRDVTV